MEDEILLTWFARVKSLSRMGHLSQHNELTSVLVNQVEITTAALMVLGIMQYQ